MSLIVKRGHVQVRENGLRSFLWSKRYLVLREATLTFHKNENTFQALHLVLLKDIERVERTDNREYCIELATSQGKFYISTTSDQELYSWIDCIYNRSPLGISSPTNFVHEVHVGFDPENGVFTVSLIDLGAAQTVEGTPAKLENHTGRNDKESASSS